MREIHRYRRKGPEQFCGLCDCDLPGCVATGVTREAVLEEIHEAIAFHIEGLREHGEHVPEPQSTAEVVDVGAVQAE